ncbi:hypothetical protein LCGC14_1852450 [marine sediment metagenome]|uniref:Uncharacterized protein n=1 Tax=marine sediment metagenome TaxID=412755 RepID=A0A0F9J937_9ZZZZ
MEMSKEQKAGCWDMMTRAIGEMIEKLSESNLKDLTQMVQELMEATERVVKEISCSMN